LRRRWLWRIAPDRWYKGQQDAMQRGPTKVLQ
jgi:hypothetical protein